MLPESKRESGDGSKGGDDSDRRRSAVVGSTELGERKAETGMQRSQAQTLQRTGPVRARRLDHLGRPITTAKNDHSGEPLHVVYTEAVTASASTADETNSATAVRVCKDAQSAIFCAWAIHECERELGLGKGEGKDAIYFDTNEYTPCCTCRINIRLAA
ncbi:Hypothetical Protein FCC1311_066112 [Hondaea fermentalgiana]|uniref:Uncharacterized protein n=1 Tax=Hondaea fermentalgiana TaxID=2315210 RepID=A0A2R5GHN4_9STRA|nr:Hypothetical Protein FCC1311_066112 [Hondaea fermentalgiana]|eukprot:GBG30392.1 Hypothetical Protein FCC1311_066112 [Hondaea fermentalgiana]